MRRPQTKPPGILILQHWSSPNSPACNKLSSIIPQIEDDDVDVEEDEDEEGGGDNKDISKRARFNILSATSLFVVPPTCCEVFSGADLEVMGSTRLPKGGLELNFYAVFMSFVRVSRMLILVSNLFLKLVSIA